MASTPVSMKAVPYSMSTAEANGRPRSSRRLRRVEETSAGGLVVASYGVAEPSAVLIARTDRRGRLAWSIPKGHIEPGETAEDAAIREISEETGIVGQVIAPVGTIDFWFVADGRRVHKTVHHFLLRPVGGALSTADHEVTDVAWVPLPEAIERLAHADERELAARAYNMLVDTGPVSP